MGITQTAYSRHRGVSEGAVRKAIREGRISRNPDGSIDPEKADAEWEKNTLNTPVKKRKYKKTDKKKSVPNEAVNTVKEVTASISSSGGTTLLQARTANEVLKAQTAKVKLSYLKNDLIEREKVITHVFKLARLERESWLNWPIRASVVIGAKLNIDSNKLNILLEDEVRRHLEEMGDFEFKIE